MVGVRVSSSSIESGRVKLVGLSLLRRRIWHRFKFTRDAPKMSEANRRVDSAKPNPVGVHKHPRSQSFLTIAFATWRFGGSELWRGADFVAQQTMLRCATKGWVVAQGGWRGGGRKLQEKKSAPLG